MWGIFQALVDRLNKSGLRQLEAGANRPQSVIGTQRVENNFSMFNAGLFNSDVDYGEECENIRKTLTKSVAVPLLDNQNRTQAGQGKWECGLPADFIDGDQMTLQELMSLERMPHTTLDGNHHNRQLWIVSS